MKHLIILLVFGFCLIGYSQEQPKQFYFFNYDIEQSFSGASSFVYDNGKEKVDSLRTEWLKQFDKVYLFTVTQSGKVLAYIDSDLNFVVTDSTVDKEKFKSSLFLLFLQQQEIQRQQRRIK